MGFHDIRFPVSLSFGSVGGPERRTEIVTLANGHEERNAPWAHSRRRYDAGLGLRSMDDIDALIAFFEGRKGQLYGFRWKDWADYKSCVPSRAPSGIDQLLGIGDEVTSTFALRKLYTSGAGSYDRPITKPVLGTVLVTLGNIPQQESIDYTVDYTNGEIIFAHPPDIGVDIRAGFEFDVPVRFDSDAIRVSAANFNAGEVPDIPVVEVRQ